MVQFKVKRGTIDELRNIGIAARNNEEVLSQFPELKPDISPWNNKFARFKLEKGQVNIALGNGSALEIFNSNLLEFVKIKEIAK